MPLITEFLDIPAGANLVRINAFSNGIVVVQYLEAKPDSKGRVKLFVKGWGRISSRDPEFKGSSTATNQLLYFVEEDVLVEAHHDPEILRSKRKYLPSFSRSKESRNGQRNRAKDLPFNPEVHAEATEIQPYLTNEVVETFIAANS